MPEVPVPADPVAANRAWWNGMAALHREAKAGFYEPTALVAGASSFRDTEDAALAAAFPAGVAGLDALHLQCHLALDAITLARRGARVTAVDFSPVALEGAAALAERCGVGLRLVESDALRLPMDLEGAFDLVWATIGVIYWHADIAAWMRSAAGALRPGGRLVLVELHPLYGMPAKVDPLVTDFPYLHDGPHAYDEPGSYADPTAQLAVTTSVSFPHGLGEIVTAAAAAGLRIDRLDEHVDSAMDPRGTLLQREPDGRYRWRLGEGDAGRPPYPAPILFTLIATRA